MSAIGLQCNPNGPMERPTIYDDQQSLMAALEDAGMPDWLADEFACALHQGWGPQTVAAMVASLKGSLDQIVDEYVKERRAAA